MAVIPADEGRGSDHPRQIVARNAEPAVVGRAGGEDHRIVEAAQLVDRHVPADQDMAHEADIVAQRYLFVAPGDCLDRLVVRCDSGPDQAVGDGKPVDDINGDAVAIVLLERFRAVIAGGAGTDHRDMPHCASSPQTRRDANALAWRGKRRSPAQP